MELPAAVHRDLLDYGKLLASETGTKAAEPGKLIVPMVSRFMESDRGFTRGRKARKP